MSRACDRKARDDWEASVVINRTCSLADGRERFTWFRFLISLLVRKSGSLLVSQKVDEISEIYDDLLKFSE